MLVVNHNLTAQNANRQLNIVTGLKMKSTEKLSSGYRINRAADDAAGLSISEKLRWQLRGLNRASQNIQDGISLVQVADGALGEIHSMLHRMKELSVQASNDTNTDSDREQLQNEVRELKREISRTFNTTDFNTMPIFRCPYTIGVAEDPNDIQMFNSNASGDQITGSGGLIFNSKRYTWGELGASVSNGVFTADFSTKFTDPDNGELIELGAKKGDTVADVIRYYQVTSDAEGAYVNNLPAARWAETAASGKWAGIDAFSVEDGMYTFSFHGMDVSFAPDEDDDRETVISRLNPDTLSSEKTMYFMSRAAGTAGENAVHSTRSTMVLDVTASTKADISGFTYEISADETGVTVRQTNGNDNISHKKIAWSDFRNINTGEAFSFTDWGLSDSGNPQTFDADATYRYRDLTDHPDMETYIDFTFTVKDEASKQGIIDGLNGIVLTADPVSAPLREGGSTDKGGAAVQLQYHSNISEFTFQRDVLGRTFNDEPSIDSIKGTVTRNREYTGTVDSYVQTHAMKEVYVMKVTETYDAQGHKTGSLEEYEKLTDQAPGDPVSTTEGEGDAAVTTKVFYKEWEGGAERQFQYFYDDNGVKKGGNSYALDGIFAKDENGDTIGNDDDHTRYAETTEGSAGQKYIYTDTGWSKDKTYRVFLNQYEYANPSGQVVLEGTGSTQYSPDRQTHVDAMNGVVDWKGDPVDSTAMSGAERIRITNADGSTTLYATAFSIDSVFLQYNGTDYYQNGRGILMNYYNEHYDSADGSGAEHSVVHTEIMPSDEAKRTFRKADVSKGFSLRTDYESVTPPPPEKLIHIQSGALGHQSIDLTWEGMSLSTIGLGSANVSTHARAQRTMSLVDKATDIVSTARSRFGAYQNRMEHAMRIDDYTAENTQAAESRIRDTDMAKESVAFAKHSVLEQVGQSMLSQANQSTQGVLKILG